MNFIINNAKIQVFNPAGEAVALDSSSIMTNDVWVDTFFRKDASDILKDVLVFIYNKFTRKFGSEESYCRFLIDGVSCSLEIFKGILQCVVLGTSGLDFTIDEDMEDMVIPTSLSYEFDKVFDCSYEDLVSVMMSVVQGNTDKTIDLNEKNLVSLIKLFVSSIIVDTGFFQESDIQHSFVVSSITFDEFRSLLSDDVLDEFDSYVETCKNVYSDFDFNIQKWKSDVISYLGENLILDWVDLWEKYNT